MVNAIATTAFFCNFDIIPRIALKFSLCLAIPLVRYKERCTARRGKSLNEMRKEVESQEMRKGESWTARGGRKRKKGEIINGIERWRARRATSLSGQKKEPDNKREREISAVEWSPYLISFLYHSFTNLF